MIKERNILGIRSNYIAVDLIKHMWTLLKCTSFWCSVILFHFHEIFFFNYDFFWELNSINQIPLVTLTIAISCTVYSINSYLIKFETSLKNYCFASHWCRFNNIQVGWYRMCSIKGAIHRRRHQFFENFDPPSSSFLLDKVIK